MAHVLLPTDLSENSLNAATYALRLFGAEGNHFTLLHVLAPSVSMEGVDVSTDMLIAREATEGLRAFAERVAGSVPVPYGALSTMIEHGELPRTIRNMTDGDAPPTIVVMGTQGASGLQEVLIGSNTADVIKHGGLPVLAVPNGTTYTSPKRILLADDAGPMERSTLAPLLDIARWSQSEITIVRVVNDATTVEHDTDDTPYDLLLGAIPHTHHYMGNENVHAALNAMADQSDAQLVVLVHRQRGIFDGLFHRSTSARMVMHTHVPMLVLQQR